MTPEQRQQEIDRLYGIIAAHYKAIGEHYEAIDRLKQQKGKPKTGVGLQAVARRQAWEQRKTSSLK